MRDSGGFHRASMIAAGIAGAILIFSFIAPGLYLREMTGAICAQAERARDSLMAGDVNGALERIELVEEAYGGRSGIVRLFFSHEELDELERAISTALDLARLGQSDNLICELDDILGIAEHMEAVEGWDLSNIL